MIAEDDLARAGNDAGAEREEQNENTPRPAPGGEGEDNGAASFAEASSAGMAHRHDADDPIASTAGIAQIDDDVGPPPSTAMLEPLPVLWVDQGKKKRERKVEYIADDDVDPDRPMGGMGKDDVFSEKVRAKGALQRTSDAKEEKREVTHDPAPFDFAEFDDGTVQRSKGVPREEDVETGSEPLTTLRTPATARIRGLDGGPTDHERRSFGAAPGLGQNQGDSVPRIPEAFLVEEGDGVIAGYAEPLLPWWKQRRTRFLMAVVILLIAIMAIALGVTLSRSDPTPQTEFIELTPSPTVSPAPTAERSSRPSMSPAPSSSPTACSLTISTQRRTLEMPLDSLVNPKVAIDGKRMVVVAKDSNLDYVYIMFYSLQNGEWKRSDKYYIEELGLDRKKYIGKNFDDYSVALSDGTALVSVPGKKMEGFDGGMTGTVFIYEQGPGGVWEEVKVPLAPAPQDWSSGSGGENLFFRFGLALGIGGDFACVTATEYEFSDGQMTSWIEKDLSDYVYVFRRIRGKWTKIQRIDYGFANSPLASWWLGWSTGDPASCSVEGNTLVVGPGIYVYDSGLQEFLLQDELPAPFESISGNYLVSRETNDEVFVYRRRDFNGPFLLVQRLQSSDYGQGFGNALALNEDVLVVGGNDMANTTFIFTKQDGYFEEGSSSHGVDRAYRSFAVSERSVIATSGTAVHTFSIEDCTQSMPTQSPTTSIAPSSTSLPTEAATNRPTARMTASFLSYDPTASPMIRPSNSPSRSLSPTQSGEPTMSPSESLSPTELCFWIDILVVFDDYPEETSWSISRIDSESGSQEVVKTYGPFPGPLGIAVESVCLPEGSYQFTIMDWDGICCDDGEGIYELASYGDTIAWGGTFRREETVAFDVPFEPNLVPSQGPSMSSSPTTSHKPTPIPTEQPASPTWPPWTPYPTPQPIPTEQPEFPTWAPSTPFPTPRPNSAQPSATLIRACLTQQQCESQRKTNEFIDFRVGNYPVYGCFQKGDILYWGLGGSEEQMSESSLGGAKVRVWCP